jgi:hypothetical protein
VLHKHGRNGVSEWIETNAQSAEEKEEEEEEEEEENAAAEARTFEDMDYLIAVLDALLSMITNEQFADNLDTVLHLSPTGFSTFARSRRAHARSTTKWFSVYRLSGVQWSLKRTAACVRDVVDHRAF